MIECAEHKKKARRINDAPSNKTYGNCLLGFHCSQNSPAANRAVAGFLLVASCQQDNLSTGYPQSLVDVLGIVSTGPVHCSNWPIRHRRKSDCSYLQQQSTVISEREQSPTLSQTQVAIRASPKASRPTPTLWKDLYLSPDLALTWSAEGSGS